MASILEKLRIITLSNVHGVLDAFINLNDVGALKVYARDLEGAVRQMEQLDNGLQGSIDTLTKDIGKSQRLADGWQLDIDTLLTDADPSNDPQALKIQVDLDATNEDLVLMREKLAQKKADHEKATQVIGALNAKLAQTVRRIKELEEAEKETAADHQAAQSMENVSKVFGDQPSVDNVGQKIMEKNAATRAELNRAMGKATDVTMDDTRIASASAALARRKAELEAQKNAA